MATLTASVRLRFIGQTGGRAKKGHRSATIVLLAAVALASWQWSSLPAWPVFVPTLLVAVINAPTDAAAARFDAIAGQPVLITICRVLPMLGWSVTIALAVLGHGVEAAAIAVATGGVAGWVAVLRVMAWRCSERHSGDLMVFAIIATSAAFGTLALPLAPLVLAIGTLWLWRRAKGAMWLLT